MGDREREREREGGREREEEREQGRERERDYVCFACVRNSKCLDAGVC